MKTEPGRAGGRARRRARELALQALYQWQLAGQSPEAIIHQFNASPGAEDADIDYFGELISGITANAGEIDAQLAEFIDRQVSELDPVEHAALLIGVFELTHRLEIPFRVVINEAVELSKRFGAEDGHKYVNAVLDRAAHVFRLVETASGTRTS